MPKIYDKAVALQKRANRAEERIKELEAENASLNKLVSEQDAQLKQIYQIIYDTKQELGIK